MILKTQQGTDASTLGLAAYPQTDMRYWKQQGFIRYVGASTHNHTFWVTEIITSV